MQKFENVGFDLSLLLVVLCGLAIVQKTSRKKGKRYLYRVDHFTGTQRASYVKHFYKNDDSCTGFGSHNLNQCPSECVIRSWVRKLGATGSTLNQNEN